MAFWEEHRRAMGYMDDIREALSTLRASGQDVAFYEDALPTWYSVVFAVNFPWGQGVTYARPLLAPVEISLLRALAGHIDSHKIVPALQPSFVSEAMVLLGDLRKLAETEESLSDEVRTYLIALIDSTADTIRNHETAGNMAVRRKVMEVLGGATSIEQTLPEEKRKAWKEKGAQLMLVALGSVASKALEVTGEVVTQAITGGAVGS